MLVSVPASQYWSDSRYARRSCAPPGMNLSSFGIMRSTCICRSPLERPSFFLPPRSFRSSVIGDQGLAVVVVGHREASQPRQLHQLRGAERAEDRAVARLVLAQHRQDLRRHLLHEDLCHGHEVGGAQVGPAALRGGGVGAPVGGDVQPQVESRQVTREVTPGARKGVGQVRIERHQHHADASPAP